ncbi:MAG: hypothetical protein WC761_05025 [Candidatus Paceibacterota bacterium]|jgi:hypothetical protein
MPEEDKSKIDRLRDALYSRKIKIKPSFVLDLHGHKNAVEDKWTEPVPQSTLKEKPPKDFSKKIFWGAIAFFAVCTLVAGYVFLMGTNLISANNIKVDIVGPSAIRAGEVTTLNIAVTNKNDVALEIADLIIEYPDGTRNADDQLTPLPRERVALGTIEPGETVRQSIDAVLYGEEGKTVAVPMTIEYRLPNSTSVFEKEILYEGLVGTAPLNVAVEAFKEVNAQQDYALKITVTSNSSSIVKNILLKGDLPKGFDVVAVSPEPFKEGTTGGESTLWNLGDIEPGGQRVITITGKIYGDQNEQRYFKFNAGVATSQNKNSFGAAIAGVTHTVNIKRAFIGVSLLFDRKEADNYVAKSGTEVGAVIAWKNNLDVPVYDVTIDTVVTGDIVDHDSIVASSGFYDSNKGVIRWNQGYDKNLKSLAPGQTGGVDFAFDLLRSSNVLSSRLTNPEFTVTITVRAKRRLESGVPEEIISTVQKTIKVISSANLTSQIVHTVGPIENTGEIPPVVGKKTTYTIIWAVTNTFNQLTDGKVVATLPDYISWENVVSPASENISYNATSREVTWNLGTVSAQASGAPVVRQAAFQIGLTPSISQTQMPPVTVNVANFSANDTFTGLIITAENDPLNTELPTDPSYGFGDAQVQP